MAEYDAFGRKTGESPVEQERTAASQPVPAPASPAPAAPQSKAFPVMLAVALVVVMGSIGAAFSLLAGGTEGSALEPAPVEEAPPAAPQREPAAPQREEKAPARKPTVDRGTLLDRPLLARAVKAMRVAELGRPVSLRVAPERVDAQLVTSKGVLRTVQVGIGGVPRELNATEAGPVPSMPWSAVDPAAPQRLVRAATEREKRSVANVDYLVLLDLGKPTWGLFFKDGTHYQGNAAGRQPRRIGP